MSTAPSRRRSADIPEIDFELPACPECGRSIESFGGGTRYRTEPTGEVVKVVHTTCDCGIGLKIRVRRKNFSLSVLRTLGAAKASITGIEHDH